MQNIDTFKATVRPEKAVLGLYRPGSTHMVGDGFPVRNLFPSNDLDRQLSPFLMLDYAGPYQFPPTEHPRGVGEHPHRGFETVTIIYEGAVAHRDSAGNAGIIGPGDVQWMTAAAGVVHEEVHEQEFARRGGTLHAIQLWVNLPKAVKMSAPRYQTILNRDIPVVELDGGKGRLRVIAGSFAGAKGPARTVTPVHLYDLQLAAGGHTAIELPEQYSSALFLLQGTAVLNGSTRMTEASLAVLDRSGTVLTVQAEDDSRLLVMSGEPIHEPIARYGPFVMNTKEELAQAMQDYQAGRMGHLS